MREVTELNFECLNGDEESDESAQKHVFTEMAELQRGFNDMASSIRLFSKYIPKEVVKELMMMGVTSSANSMVSKVLTVTFVDISGFSMMCESLQTEDLVSLAEQYFETVTKTLTAHGCTIDKYIGDHGDGLLGCTARLCDSRVQCLLRGLARDDGHCEGARGVLGVRHNPHHPHRRPSRRCRRGQHRMC